MPKLKSGPAIRWQRCTAKCGCDRNPSRYDRCRCKGGCERGSVDRLQRTLYALAVNLIMMKGWASKRHGLLYCPITGHPFYFADGHVDKVGPLYLPGSVVLVSAEGNLMRSHTELPNLAGYIADIQSASANVRVTAKSDLSPLPARRQTGKGTVSGADALLSGPYGH